MVAPTCCKDYGILSVVFQTYADVKCHFKIPNTVFYPKPKVDSAVLELKLKKPPVDAPYEQLFEMIRMAFGADRGDRFTLKMSFDDTNMTEHFEV